MVGEIYWGFCLDLIDAPPLWITGGNPISQTRLSLPGSNNKNMQKG